MKRWSTALALALTVGTANAADRGDANHPPRALGRQHAHAQPHGHAHHPHFGHRGPGDRWFGGFSHDPFGPYGHWDYWAIDPPGYWFDFYGPPLYMPGEAVYGPGVTRQFMGIQPVAPQAPAVAPARPLVPADRAPPKPPPGRSTNAEAVALGQKFVGFGDAQFAEQQFGQAYARYKKAAQAAPQLAVAYQRQGWALVALARYELAAAAFKKGLDLAPDWPASDFRLDELYGPNRMAKAAHVDALAEAARQQPRNADLLFMVGVFLYFDGEPDRARPFFERVVELAPGVGLPPGRFLQEIGQAEL